MANIVTRFKCVIVFFNCEEFGIYHLTNEKVFSRFGFTNAIFKFKDISCKVTPVDSNYFHPKFKQPIYTALNSEKARKIGIFLPRWNISLRDYLST